MGENSENKVDFPCSQENENEKWSDKPPRPFAKKNGIIVLGKITLTLL